MILQTYHLQNTLRCCLTTGMEPRIFAQSTITDYLHDAGFRITADSSVQEFYLSETAAFFNAERKREEIGIVLPFTGAQPLLSFAAQPDMDRGDAVRELYRLFDTLLAAYNTGALSEQVFRTAAAAPLCLLRDTTQHDLIILPPRLVQRCTLAEPAAALTYHYPYIHPDAERISLSGAASFFLSAVSYRCIAAVAPFNAAAVPFDGMDTPDCQTETNPEAAEQLVQNIRDGVFIPIELRCPGLAPELCKLIDAGLMTGSKPAQADPSGCEKLCEYRDPTLPLFDTGKAAAFNAEHRQQHTDNTAAVGTADAAGTSFKTHSADASAGTAQDRLAAFIKIERKRISRKRFISKNIGKITAAVLGVILLAVASTAIIRAITQPPETAGLSPQAVVQGFYTAVGSLDQARVSAYTKNKAGSEYEGLLVHLFVTSKMREAYERKKIYYSPQEFLELCTAVQTKQQKQTADSPDTETAAEHYKDAVITALDGGSIYGLSQLSITPAPDEGFFDVHFYYWVPLFPSETTASLMDESEEFITERQFFPVQILSYRDRVQIISVSGNFFIGAIEQIERRVVTESSTILIEDTLLPPEKQPEYLQRM